MLDIERELQEDTTGEYKKNVLLKLRTLSAQARHELNQGLIPDEYEKLNKLLQSVEASIKIIEQY